eukprot:11390332-Ditylum_brightwellii.AAC.1
MHVGKDGEPPVIPTPTNCCAHCCDTTGILCDSYQADKGERTGTGENKVKEVKGQLLHTKGKESAVNVHSGGTIFVDHASQLIYIANQVQQYHGNNGASKSAAWDDHCEAIQ